jgi:hypothetical protein
MCVYVCYGKPLVTGPSKVSPVKPLRRTITIRINWFFGLRLSHSNNYCRFTYVVIFLTVYYKIFPSELLWSASCDNCLPQEIQKKKEYNGETKTGVTSIDLYTIYDYVWKFGLIIIITKIVLCITT